MKIRPVGTKSFHADGQTDMTKLRVAFRNFANVPKICWWAAHYYYKILIPYSRTEHVHLERWKFLSKFIL